MLPSHVLDQRSARLGRSTDGEDRVLQVTKARADTAPGEAEEEVEEDDEDKAVSKQGWRKRMREDNSPGAAEGGPAAVHNKLPAVVPIPVLP